VGLALPHPIPLPAEGDAYRIRLRRPHPGQRAMIEAAKRFNVACMGRRFGKTEFGLERLAPLVAGGEPCAWFAPGYKYVGDVWRDAKRILRPVIASKNEQEKRLETITGGVLEVWTLDGEDPARGRKYRRVVIDEAAIVRDLMKKWNEAIRPTLTDLRGDAWFLSTPKGANDFKALFDRHKTRPNWASFQAPTHANPFIDPAELEEARLDLPELVWRQEFLAQFVDMAGLIVEREWLQVVPDYPRDQMRIGIGVDLAVSLRDNAATPAQQKAKRDPDYFAIVVLGWHADGTLYVLDAYRARLKFHQQLEAVKEYAEKWSPGAIAIEAVQYQAVLAQELLRTTTLPVVPVTPSKDKLTRFQPMVGRYAHGFVRHLPTLPEAFTEELLSFPVGDHDDFVDALGYAHAAVGMGSAGAVALAGNTLELDNYATA
jgi:predicted phage terminase large subunit-like protein